MTSTLKKAGKPRKALVERAAEHLGHVFKDPPALAAAGSAKPAAKVASVGALPANSGQVDWSRRSVEIDIARLNKLGFWASDGSRRVINEELRGIKLNVLQQVARLEEAGSEKANIVMVTSGGSAEGKTFTAINLALSLAAEKDCDALLVDTDPGPSSVLQTLGLTAEEGIVDVLEDQDRSIDSVILDTNIDGLSILPAGRRHPLGPELLASNRMRRVLSDLSLRNRRQVIVLDSFPVLKASEPSVLAKYAGQIVFVIGADETTAAETKEALSIIKLCPNVGFVLNKAGKHYAPGMFGAEARG